MKPKTYHRDLRNCQRIRITIALPVTARIQSAYGQQSPNLAVRKLAEWFFVPVQAGSFPVECSIPGHADGGMVGPITVQ